MDHVKIENAPDAIPQPTTESHAGCAFRTGLGARYVARSGGGGARDFYIRRVILRNAEGDARWNFCYACGY